MNNLAELFQRAVTYHQSGNLAQAEPLYRQILQADPSHHEAMHLLGLLAHQTGHQEPALALLRQAVALNPAADGVHFNLGIVLMSRKQFAEAEQHFRQVLRLNPSHAEAHVNLGNALMNQDRLAEAITCYRQALRLQPLHADAHINLGNVLLRQEQVDQAIACYQEALRINPKHAPALNNLGNALGGQGRLDEAAQCYRQALRLDPGNAKAHYNLGNVLKDQGQLTEAADCYRQALRLEPAHVGAHNNLGIILQDQGHMAEAVACYRQALRINPGNLDSYNNMGNAFKEQGQIAEADACFQQALNVNPNHELVLWNRSLLRLLQGDLADGWPDYDLRWKQPGIVPRPFSQPRWDGAALEGKTILVHAEQGLGDSIHFLRYLPLVKCRGGTVVFECQPGLFKLLKGIEGVDQLIAAGTPLPSFDVHAPLMTLPGIIGTTLTTIPANIPYLTADPERVEYWRQELVPLSGFKIGIAWQGDLKHKGYGNRSLANRSFPLKVFETLAGVEGVRLMSLQVGPGSEQLATASFPVTDLGGRFNPNSLEDLAGALMNLDLVVSVDTAVAHMAGALGVPIWNVISVAACWRWLLGRSDSPWYPTMRLFRQSRFGHWEEVFERVTEEVRRVIATK